MVTQSLSPLLIAEDSDEDFEVLELLMQQMKVQNPIYRCTTGDNVLEFVYQAGELGMQCSGQRPSVILLDLNLPGTDGREVLEQLKQDQTLREIPIVVFTTSSNPQDIEFCYQNGANGYLIKPVDSEKLERTVQAFVDYWLQVNISPVGASDGGFPKAH
jgi:CheY-like chemotaxis protein